MEILKYKEFEGSAELDMNRNVCRGKILFVDDVVTYESKSIDGLQKEFEAAVDDYIDTCKQVGKEPQKSCRGQFNVRVTPELHRAATRRAISDETSLNDVVFQALSVYLAPATGAAFAGNQGDMMNPQNFFIEKIASNKGISWSSVGASVLLFSSPTRAKKAVTKEEYWDAIGSSSVVEVEALPTTIKEKSYAH